MGRPIEQRIYSAAKARATRRGLPFNLELSDIKIPSHCPILGIPLVSVVGCGMGSIKARNNSPSIDRIDNTKGYVKGNVIIISMRANNLKVTGRLKRYLPLLISSEFAVSNHRTRGHGLLDNGLVVIKTISDTQFSAKCLYCV